MAEKCTPEKPGSRADQEDQQCPPSRLRLPLKTLDDVKVELAKLYREGKAGRRPIADVSRLANVLDILGRRIEGSELAGRVDELEESMKGPKK